jgi:hypothetical protein
MSRKDWKRALSIAIPWGVLNGLTYIIWGPEVQTFTNIGILSVLAIYVIYKQRKHDKTT